MIFYIVAGSGVGWSLVLAGRAAGLPQPGWMTDGSAVARGLALLLGFCVIQAIRRTLPGRMVERAVRRIAFRTIWTVGEISHKR